MKYKKFIKKLKQKLRTRHAHLKDNLPTDLNFETTTYCNLDCIYCGREHLVKNKLMDSGEMPLTLIHKIIDEFREISHLTDTVLSICPVGLGEPLLDSRFFEIVSLIHKSIPTAIIHANTNAILLNENKIDQIVNSNLDYLVLSINVWSRHDYISLHKADHFNKVQSNIVNLIQASRGNKTRLIVQLLDINLNSPHITDFREFWSKYLKPSNYDIKTFHPLKEHIQQIMSEDELSAYSTYLGEDDNNLIENRHPCSSLFRTCAINKDGFVFPCCMGLWYGPKSDICLGNINEVSIREIYEKRGTYHKLRELHLQGRWNEIDACRTCSGGHTEGSINIFFKVGNQWV